MNDDQVESVGAPSFDEAPGLDIRGDHGPNETSDTDWPPPSPRVGAEETTAATHLSAPRARGRALGEDDFASFIALFEWLCDALPATPRPQVMTILKWMPRTGAFDSERPYRNSPDLLPPIATYFPMEKRLLTDEFEMLRERRLAAWITPVSRQMLVLPEAAAASLRALWEGEAQVITPPRPVLALGHSSHVRHLIAIPSKRATHDGAHLLLVIGWETHIQAHPLLEREMLAQAVEGVHRLLENEAERPSIGNSQTQDLAHELALALFYEGAQLIGETIRTPSEGIEMRFSMLERYLRAAEASAQAGNPETVRDTLERARDVLAQVRELNDQMGWVAYELSRLSLASQRPVTERESLDLMECFSRQIESLPGFLQHLVKLEIESPDDSPVRVIANEALLSEAILLLLRHAVAEAPTGEQVHGVVRHGLTKGIVALQIPGTGLRPSEARQVWSPVLAPRMRRLNESSHVSGLGPFLARRIGDAHNLASSHGAYRVGIINKPGEGHAYYLAAPLLPPLWKGDIP